MSQCSMWGRGAQGTGSGPDCLGSNPGSAFPSSVVLDKLPNSFSFSFYLYNGDDGGTIYDIWSPEGFNECYASKMPRTGRGTK